MSHLDQLLTSLTRPLTQQVFRTQASSSPSALVLRETHHDDQRTLRTSDQPSAEATVIAIDVSGSMDEPYTGAANKLAAAEAAAITFIVTKASISSGDHIGLVSFDEHASELCPCRPVTEHRKDLIRTVQGLRIGGGTDIAAPLNQARAMLAFAPAHMQRRIVLITDGHGGQPLEIARGMQNEGVVVDVIGIGDTPDRVNESLLRRVASVVDGQSRYVFIRDLRALVQHTTSISRRVTRKAVMP